MAVAYTNVKGVFAHYMIGSISSSQRAVDDVTQAQAMGIDAFALNVQFPSAPWALSTISALFAAAASSSNFKLFFSLDIAACPNPPDFSPLLRQYLTHPAYYRPSGRPLISTFHGGTQSPSTWSSLLSDLRSSTSTNPLFIPNFEDASPFGSTYPSSLLSSFPVDGVLGWETAWPLAYAPPSQNAQADASNLATAHAASKYYAQPVSTYQFKHIDNNQNWFRRGSSELINGMRRALSLQPDFVELLTWNDGGEGHWFGNVWPEGITGPMVDMIRGFEHRAWQVVLAPFIGALKAGAADEGQIFPPSGRTIAGAFWYRPLMKTANCWTDAQGMGKPSGWEDAEDVVSVAVMLAANVKPGSVLIKVWSGSTLVIKMAGRPGLNVLDVAANYGTQTVQVVANPSGQVLAQGVGSIQVTGDIGQLGGLCNYNYHVVEIA
ncbi:glycoside hydrolase [Echria macrotheca]|uniref:Glycoside hydrolase n=1 Tax=Echria macrotheca TaxID=438768 RepID=A0AAJ0BLX9_9PEZI|nr:glycoside hydrolase [Echria macrotheca]